ncbi:unnamed protein product [Coffea canephora]|uniref:DH200=94 genomic scaffold, scaffold_5413 n=1 Tax=Coffea canephora TaxID=49390 RepID=A0A068VPK9_COFCA|nr:unnamed protein product [Coffea canephora]
MTSRPSFSLVLFAILLLSAASPGVLGICVYSIFGSPPDDCGDCTEGSMCDPPFEGAISQPNDPCTYCNSGLYCMPVAGGSYGFCVPPGR